MEKHGNHFKTIYYLEVLKRHNQKKKEKEQKFRRVVS